MNSDTLATKDPISPPKNNVAALTAACGNGVSGVIIFALLPILLAVCADHLKLTAVQAGMLASTYFASYALITAISIFWILRVQWQAATYAAIGIMIVSIISIVILETYKATLIGLFFCGIGASILHALGYGIVSEMHNTDRGFAIKLIPEQLVPAAILLLLSAYFAEFLNFKVLFSCILVTLIIHLFLVSGIPKKRTVKSESAKLNLSNGTGLALLALCISFSGFAGLWAFLERIANNGGIDIVYAGQLISIGLISAGIGPFVVPFIPARLGRSIPLVLSTLAAVLPLLLLTDVTPLRYALVMVFLPAAWFMGNAYFCSVVSDKDDTGRMIGLIPFALSCGAIIGPPVFGWLLNSYGFTAAYWFCAIAFVSGATIIIFLNQSTNGDTDASTA
ncbi:MAG TPA: MFS transporter [Porticoccaceae bacterium]|nr:MFS transporter [Porticoccaceae bacterium]